MILSRHDDELSIAVDAARRAGRIQMERYERLERIVHKSEHDVVTEVDEMSEQLIISSIRSAYPHDGFLAEESGTTAAIAPVSQSGVESDVDPAAQRVWIIDPLDGTVNYANGIPVFCVSIGLVIGGQPVLGVVYDPTRDELFTAQAGHGARLDDQPIRQPQKEKLSDYVVSIALSRVGWSDRERKVRRRIRVSRSMGSAALALAYVGNGRFDAFIQSGGLSLWDICAAGLIAVEGGATVTTLDGGPWFDMAQPSKSIGLVAAAPAHHATLKELIR
ncbi:MAG TPA: inositol monophosphatase family protein [Candidatus Limnocylindrales bacterium]|nr:inositol monophosphatase family protein [Candidatus Limnocylindrales bacterium]